LFQFTERNAREMEKGFTLIEALVALAVVAVSLAAIGSLVAANVRGAVAVDQRLSLVEAARSILTSLPDRGQLAPGDSRGELAGNRWQIDVLPFTADFVDPSRPTSWVPHALVIRVQSPNGQLLRIDTVRLQRAKDGLK
jgi:general secretion pathway protein I